MIRCESENGVWLFPQISHAYICAQLVQRWMFHTIVPLDAMLYAITNHDAGWREVDNKPRIGTDNKPLTFTEHPLDEHFEIWRRSIDYNQMGSPYAGLMVCCHAENLYQRRLASKEDSKQDRAKIQVFLQELSSQIQTLQVDLMLHYGKLVEPAELEQNRQLLQLFDWMSLILCMGIPRERHNMSYGQDPPITLSVDTLGRLTVTPWVFKEPNLMIYGAGRFLKQKTFESDHALQSYYDRCTTEFKIFYVIPRTE